MPKRLLISDTNILIDMRVGQLLDAMFKLPYEYATPTTLFEEELSQYHTGLLELGLRLFSLEPTSLERKQMLGIKHSGVSSHDLDALCLAEQHSAPLLTGDGKLRQVCLEENVDVRGTVWLVGEMLVTKDITVDEATVAYQRMEADGSRLPWDEVEKQLKHFRK